MGARRPPASPVRADTPVGPPPIKLTLVVQYDDADHVVEAAQELIEASRAYGAPVACTIENMPTTIDLKP